MNKITDQLGAIFRVRFKDSLEKPLNWRMIDALATLDETEEEQQRKASAIADGPADAVDELERNSAKGEPLQ